MKKLLILLLCLLSGAAQAQALSVREQARIVNDVLTERLDVLLPDLMQKTDIDMWVIIAREYNEDPVLRTMLPLSAVMRATGAAGRATCALRKPPPV